MKTLLEKKLDIHGYNYRSADDEIIVKLSYDQQVNIRCKGNEKCLVNNTLTGWNFLTGLLHMSLRGAVIYYSVGLAIIAILFAFLGQIFPYKELSLFLIAAVGWFAGWTTYYAVTFESFNRQVRSWVDQA